MTPHLDPPAPGLARSTSAPSLPPEGRRRLPTEVLRPRRQRPSTPISRLTSDCTGRRPPRNHRGGGRIRVSVSSCSLRSPACTLGAGRGSREWLLRPLVSGQVGAGKG